MQGAASKIPLFCAGEATSEAYNTPQVEDPDPSGEERAKATWLLASRYAGR